MKQESQKPKRRDSHRRVLYDCEYEHKDKGFYEFRWREVKGYTEGGQKLYKQRSISAKTLDELRELEEKLKADKRDGYKYKQPTTLNDYVDKWLKIKKGLKENTRSNYIYMYDKFIKKTKIGTCKIQELKKSDLIEFYTNLIEKGTLSLSTCETLQNVIGPACQLCFEEDDLIRRNPATNALKELKKEERLQESEARARGEHKKPETLTLAEQIRFLDVIKDTVWESPFTIALCTGLRVGELSGLRWQNIDWDNDRIIMKQNLTYYPTKERKSVKEIHAPKTEKGIRYIPITPLVRRMLEKQQAEGRKCKTPVNGIDDFVFITREYTSHGQGTFNRALKRIVANANDAAADGEVLLPAFSTHKLRKTFACNCIRKGIGIEEIANMLGHTDIQTTHEYYLLAKDLIATDADQKLIDELKKRGVL